jgi:hypothetical protein
MAASIWRPVAIPTGSHYRYGYCFFHHWHQHKSGGFLSSVMTASLKAFRYNSVTACFFGFFCKFTAAHYDEQL